MTRRRAIGWALLLGGAAAWRLLLFVGPLGSDDLAYAENARALAEGTWTLRPDIFGLRLGYTGPTAGLFALFGAGPFLLVLPNLAASVAEVALARQLARRFLDDAGAWLAAVLVAVAPAHVHFATEAHPDAPVAALTTAALLLFLKRFPVGAGLALGAAHLMKEPAFFGLAVLAAFAGRARRGDLLRALAGFAAVAALESLAYAAASGDPLYRVHAVGREQAGTMGSALYQAAVPTGRRTLLDVPAMLFAPWSGSWSFFAFLPLAALGGAAVSCAARERRGRALAAGAAALLALLAFWPISLSPYRPAMVAHPRIFLVLVAPLAILAVRGLRALPRRAEAAALLAGLAVALASAVVLRVDARRWSAGARAAWPALLAGEVVASDPRTTGLFRLYAGYRDAGRWADWDGPPPRGPHVLVVNETWSRTLDAWYGVRPPAWAREPASPPALELRLPPRRSLRGRLTGATPAGPGDRVAVHRRGPP
jgi:4-amino-4-deoxy-L-arabinose transferase-like glycosyltransferase